MVVSLATFSRAWPTTSSSSAAGTTTTPSWSARTRSPSATATPPARMGCRKAITSSRPLESAGVTPVAKTGNLMSSIPHESRLRPSTTAPRPPRARKLSPERRLELALHGGHDHLARTDTVEKVHEQPVRLLGKLRDRNREHGRRSAGHLRPRIKRPHLGSHHLVPVTCLIQDVGENRRVEAASDPVEVLRRVPLSRGRAH